jgi:hypothetical protein
MAIGFAHLHVAQGNDSAAGTVQKGAALFALTQPQGAPKVTEHSTGTGTTSPLGITRCTLLIQAGTSIPRSGTSAPGCTNRL